MVEKKCDNCDNSIILEPNGPCETCDDDRCNWKPIGTDAVPEDTSPDTVNHPSHYADNCSLECADVMLIAFGVEGLNYFYLGNAFKYIWRHKQKNGAEDIAKAEWYLKYACKLTEGGLRRHLTAINKMTDHIAKLKGEATK